MSRSLTARRGVSGISGASGSRARTLPSSVDAISPDEGFSISGTVTFYDRPADSGNMVGRGFCPNCGCAVYSWNSGMPGMVFPRASSLDDPEVAAPQMIVYASRAPSWDHMDPALPAFLEMPEGGPKAVVHG